MLHTSDYLLFFYAYVTLPRPPPPPLSQSVTPGTPPPSPLERDVIIEWPQWPNSHKLKIQDGGGRHL